MNWINKFLSMVFVGMIKVYQFSISPYLMSSCRYAPSCSQYGIEAIKKHGPFKGGFLTLKRVLSCNPWGGHGHDPIP